ncbi:MAG: hypothetical protein ACYDGS_03200 [Thermoleophilia bacterium]
MSFLKNLFSGAQRSGWVYPDGKFELLAPNSRRYLSNLDSSVPPALLNYNGTDMTEFYVTESLDPRSKRFNQIADSNPELESVAQDDSHPIGVLAAGQARDITDGVKKETNGLFSCSTDNQAKAYASLVTLVVDGYTVALVEKEFSGLPQKGKGRGLVIMQTCKDFLITVAFRNWIGDAGRDIGVLINRPLGRFEESSPPPFGPPPPDSAWTFFRFLVDYGFYCGSAYLEMGRHRFEKDWASLLEASRKK